jgi:hypothetical protein
MTSREQTLAIVLLGAVLLTVGGVGGYMFLWQPLQRQKAAEEALNNEIADLDAQVEAQRDIVRKLELARIRSLPADETLARREYTVALEHLAEAAGVPRGYTISPKSVDNSARVVPELSKGKPVYTRVAYELVFKKADMWAVKDFLEGYYNLRLMHQITSISIKKDDDPGSKNAGRRNDLTVTLTTEAILVDGAQNRHTLLPIPTAFAAIGGGAAYKALTVTPDAARSVVPDVPDVLSPVHRDYSLMVQKDPFNGPLPKPPAFALASISPVKVKTDEKPWPVKVGVSGDGSYGATVTAIVTEKSALFAPGELKVDPKTYAIDLPKTSATEGTAEIKVTATSSDGVMKTTSFKVSVEKPVEKPEVVVGPTEDISPFVVLIGVTQRSDGSAWARICDTANRTRYQIDATNTSIKIAKEEILIPRKGWTSVDEHKHPPGVMVVSDPKSKTYRMFKVIAVDHDGLFLADLKPDAHTPAKPEKGKGGMGGFPPRPGAPVRQGHGDPLAAIGGNMVAAATPPPKYYRWSVGQSLAAIKHVPDDEAKKIMKQAEASGPVLNVAIADR